MKTKNLIFLVCVVSLIALPVFGAGKKDTADNSLEKIKAKKHIVLGLDDSFPPMGFRDESGAIVGFDIDFAREAAKESV